MLSLYGSRATHFAFLATCWWASATGLAHEGVLLKALHSIKSSDVEAHIGVLADDSFEGREAGARGGRAAAGYITEQLKKFGLQGAAGGGSYYQPFQRGYRNILAQLPGSDPQLSKEVIILGAHYDHVGYGTRSNSFGPTGYIHNGADDNASGTASLLELAEAFAALPTPPKRTLVFAFWDAEEKALRGSKHWLAHPTLELSQIKLFINMDMIGRLRKEHVEVYGTRTSKRLRQMLSRQNTDLNLRLDFTWEMKENSDHYPFYERRIPTIMLHTGLHDDYHRPHDDAHKINFAGTQEITRLIFRFASHVGDRDSIAGFRLAARREFPRSRQQMESALPKKQPRLGIQWRRNAEKIMITHVVPRSAAATAGLKVGDQLLTFSGQSLLDDALFRQHVLAAPTDTTMTIRRENTLEAVEVPIKLMGNPTRIGISWREDSAEPGTAIIARVIPGSAAAEAGLQVGDRIYDVAEMNFTNTEELKNLLTTAKSPIPITIERSGRLQSLHIEVLPEGQHLETTTTKT